MLISFPEDIQHEIINLMAKIYKNIQRCKNEKVFGHGLGLLLLALLVVGCGGNTTSTITPEEGIAKTLNGIVEAEKNKDGSKYASYFCYNYFDGYIYVPPDKIEKYYLNAEDFAKDLNSSFSSDTAQLLKLVLKALDYKKVSSEQYFVRIAKYAQFNTSTHLTKDYYETAYYTFVKRGEDWLVAKNEFITGGTFDSK